MRRTYSSTTRTYSPTTRNVLRVLGAVLVLAGAFLAVHGGMSIADDINSEFGSEEDGFGAVLELAGGLFLVVFGIGALSAGFLGAQANYAVGETSGAVREFGSAFRGEPSDGDVPRDGKFCSECGARNAAGAKFCDACGHALAPA